MEKLSSRHNDGWITDAYMRRSVSMSSTAVNMALHYLTQLSFNFGSDLDS